MKRHYTFEEVFDLDNTIKKLAMYEVSGGKMIISTDPLELINFEIKYANKFNYFKDLIQRGECSIEYLRDTVLHKNGAYPNNSEIITTPEDFLIDIEKNEQKRLEEKQIIDDFCNKFKKLIDFSGYIMEPEKDINTTTKTTTECQKLEDKNGKKQKKSTKSNKRNGESSK